MTAQEKIQKVTEISQSKGWSISVDDKNKSNIQFDFQRYTNYGQDFNFSAEMKCEGGYRIVSGQSREYPARTVCKQ